MSPDGQAIRSVSIIDTLFGAKWEWDPDDVRVKSSTAQLKLSIASDKSVVWLSTRQGASLQMSRDEVLEMMEILNREFLLDAMGQV